MVRLPVVCVRRLRRASGNGVAFGPKLLAVLRFLLLLTIVSAPVSGAVLSPRPVLAAGEFSDIGAGLPGLQYGKVAWGDYDNDGDLDLLLVGIADPSASLVYRNDSGVFTDIGAGLPGVSFGGGAWGDYDNDGDLDVLLYGDSGLGGYISHVYRNTGGVFSGGAVGLPGMWAAWQCGATTTTMAIWTPS